MARNKQIGPELKLYQIDTLKYLTRTNIITEIFTFHAFINLGGIAIANRLGINKARALESYEKNYNIKDIGEIQEVGQAHETWLRKSGFLASTEGKYELSNVAKAIYDGKITLEEYVVLILSKQWVKIKKIQGEDEYKINLLGFLLKELSKGNIASSDFVTHISAEIEKLFSNEYKGLTSSNKEAARYLKDPLLLSGIVEESNKEYRISSKYKEIVDDYIRNFDKIRNPNEINCIEEEYLNDFKYGVYDIANEENKHIYIELYPNLFRIKNDDTPKIGNFYASQIIHYGCPGCGKSYKVKEIVSTIDSDFVFRTTFHPDTDYASFVGCYKPISSNSVGSVCTEEELKKRYKESGIENSKNKIKDRVKFVLQYARSFEFLSKQNGKDLTSLYKAIFPQAEWTSSTYYVNFLEVIFEDTHENNTTINYEFIPQIFTNAYVKAWLNPDEQVYLIIEEINRGNCAQIFGDLFQLLDRDKATGYSEYPIKADKDLVNYLRNALGEEHDGIKNGELCLPPNLIIYATMNTSDQSLFPMDSAFKRRWEWEYVPINYGENIASGKFVITIGDTKYRWIDFLKVVNERIYQATTSEDKQMGNFFIKQDVDAKEFVNKVMFYLWNEVCKDEAGTQRNFFRKGKEEEKEFKFTDLFGDDQAIILNAFMAFLGISPIEESQPEEITAE